VFLYLHYMEPHAPYAPPDDLLQRLRGTKPRVNVAQVNQDVIAAAMAPPSPEMLDGLRDTYDASVLAIDAALARLLEALEERGIGPRAVLVITADHGEEFRDHGGMGHGRTLYEEVLHVPLLIRTPGQTRGRVLGRLVSSIDLAPTVLEVVGVDSPSTFEGVSFARDLDADDTATSARRLLARLWDTRPRPVVFSERYPIVEEKAPSHRNAVVLGRSKAIMWSDGRRDFFSLAKDPHEQQVNRVEAAERDGLVATLEELRRRVVQNRTAAEKQTLDPRTRDALRALGYTD
jgi:arylsulfatase A-like enzyme